MNRRSVPLFIMQVNYLINANNQRRRRVALQYDLLNLSDRTADQDRRTITALYAARTNVGRCNRLVNSRYLRLTVRFICQMTNYHIPTINVCERRVNLVTSLIECTVPYVMGCRVSIAVMYLNCTLCIFRNERWHTGYYVHVLLSILLKGSWNLLAVNNGRLNVIRHVERLNRLLMILIASSSNGNTIIIINCRESILICTTICYLNCVKLNILYVTIARVSLRKKRVSNCIDDYIFVPIYRLMNLTICTCFDAYCYRLIVYGAMYERCFNLTPLLLRFKDVFR